MKTSFIKHLPHLAAGIALATACSVAAAITQLGFALDESGSVTANNYDLEKNGLAAALAAVPTDGSVEITVISFSNGVEVLVPPTIVTSAAQLVTLRAAVSGSSRAGGSTYTNAAIGSLSYLMTNSPNYDAANNVIVNISTDGQPNSLGYCLAVDGSATNSGPASCSGTYVPQVGTSQAGAVAAATAAFASGVDSISIEAIGNFDQFDLNNMLAIAGPGAVQLAANATNIPYPIGTSFVVPVTSFDAYATVIDAKVRTVVVPPSGVPVPGGLALMGLGLAVLGWAGKRRS